MIREQAAAYAPEVAATLYEIADELESIETTFGARPAEPANDPVTAIMPDAG